MSGWQDEPLKAGSLKYKQILIEKVYESSTKNITRDTNTQTHVAKDNKYISIAMKIRVTKQVDAQQSSKKLEFFRYICGGCLKIWTTQFFWLVSMNTRIVQQLVLIIYLLASLNLDTMAINTSGFSEADVYAIVYMYINEILIRINSNRTEMKYITVDNVLEWNNGEVAKMCYNIKVKIQIISRTVIENWSALKPNLENFRNRNEGDEERDFLWKCPSYFQFSQ